MPPSTGFAAPSIPSQTRSSPSRHPAPGGPRRWFERRLQIYLVRSFRRLVDPAAGAIVAFENGGDRTDDTLDLLIAMGLLTGWPDLGLILPFARIHWIEVKLEKTEAHARTDLTDDQREVHTLLAGYGFKVSVVRNAAEFWRVVDSYQVPHKPPPPAHQQLQLPNLRPPPRGRRGASPLAT